MTEDDLKNMRLHEEKQLGNLTIIRVYKGWIYTQTRKMHCNGVGDQVVMTSTFVPYS